MYPGSSVIHMTKSRIARKNKKQKAIHSQGRKGKTAARLIVSIPNSQNARELKPWFNIPGEMLVRNPTKIDV